jgi:hypothetical protein
MQGGIRTPDSQPQSRDTQTAGSHRSARTGWVAGDGQPARLELLGSD